MTAKRKRRSYRELCEAHPAVREVWSEGADGMWADLKPGYCCALLEVSQCHEWTWLELWHRVQDIQVAAEWLGTEK